MKILESSAGLLTNFEVLDFLRNKSHSTTEDDNLSESKNVNLEVGEANQYDKLKRNSTSSEMKVYDYLIETAARDQTRECVAEFLQKCKKFDFAQADLLPILNIRPSKPSTPVELHSIIESFFERYENQVDEITQLIEEVLPPRPITKTIDEEELVPLGTIDEAEKKTIAEPQRSSPHPEPMTEG